MWILVAVYEIVAIIIQKRNKHEMLADHYERDFIKIPKSLNPFLWANLGHDKLN